MFDIEIPQPNKRKHAASSFPKLQPWTKRLNLLCFNNFQPLFHLLQNVRMYGTTTKNNCISAIIFPHSSHHRSSSKRPKETHVLKIKWHYKCQIINTSHGHLWRWCWRLCSLVLWRSMEEASSQVASLQTKRFFLANTVGDLQRMCGGIFKSCTTRVRNLACCAVARRTNQPNVAACICHFFIPFIIDTKAYLNTIAYDSTQQPATVL